MCTISVYFFFFKQKTAYEVRISDWSSDVCSSDLFAVVAVEPDGTVRFATPLPDRGHEPVVAKRRGEVVVMARRPGRFLRSEERRVGKECGSSGRSRGHPDH